MATAKIAITLDEKTLQRLDRLVKGRVFPNRSRAIQDAVEEKLERMEKNRLARECAKLDPSVEKLMAEEGMDEEFGTVARILRGEIRWADLNPVRGKEQAGLRPVLVLSHDVLNAHSGTVIAMAITSQPQRAGFPLTLELESSSLPKR